MCSAVETCQQLWFIVSQNYDRLTAMRARWKHLRCEGLKLHVYTISALICADSTWFLGLNQFGLYFSIFNQFWNIFVIFLTLKETEKIVMYIYLHLNKIWDPKSRIFYQLITLNRFSDNLKWILENLVLNIVIESLF